ncbi:MAG: hypothetical protein IH626_22010 [Rhodospirillales bacterium]|nr:hypothetical protein [Rhodospirillales bacterium]
MNDPFVSDGINVLPLNKLIYRLGQNARRIYNVGLGLRSSFVPCQRREVARIAVQRAQVDVLLDRLARDSAQHFDGTVLVDSMWDNPNHWVRYSLFRTALGLAYGREISLHGRYARAETAGTAARFRFDDAVNFCDMPADERAARRQARRLLAGTQRPEDILSWDLPYGLPPAIVYDGLLRRQVSPTVDVRHPGIEDHVTEALMKLQQAECVLDKVHPDLVVLSHTVDFDFGALAWLTIRNGIPGVILFGEYGLLRFFKLHEPDDVYLSANFLTREQFAALPEPKRTVLGAVGREYLERRLAAQTWDVGAIHAYQNGVTGTSRAEICRSAGWDESHPIVAVYSISWFDFPHLYGQLNFLDPLDWMQTTIEAALQSPHVNWLFRPHPLEDRYGGVSLRSLMPEHLPPHIRLAPRGSSGADIMRSVDALVTLYGTAGVEFAGLGKPVLSASRGWYHDIGFTRTPATRDDYKAALGTTWWEGLGNEQTRYLANVFAGWHFCCPDWQGGFVLGDDFEQGRLYRTIPDLFENHAEEARKEIDLISDWWGSDVKGSHSFKMLRASGYALSNVVREPAPGKGTR